MDEVKWVRCFNIPDFTGLVFYFADIEDSCVRDYDFWRIAEILNCDKSAADNDECDVVNNVGDDNDWQ